MLPSTLTKFTFQSWNSGSNPLHIHLPALEVALMFTKFTVQPWKWR